jgi:hypothetical protein
MTTKVFKPNMGPIYTACAICFLLGALAHRCSVAFDTRCVDGTTEVHLENGDGSSAWYNTEQPCKCRWWSTEECVFETRLPVYPGKG